MRHRAQRGTEAALVDFTLSPRIERHLERSVGGGSSAHEVLIEDEAIDGMDRSR